MNRTFTRLRRPRKSSNYAPVAIVHDHEEIKTEHPFTTHMGELKMKALLAFALMMGMTAAHQAYAGCTEGTKNFNYVVGYDSNGREITEVRTCKNGTYMTAAEAKAYWEAQARQGRPGCREGNKDYNFVVGYDSNGRQIVETRVCRNGSYMTAAERQAYAEAIAKTKQPCPEGKVKVVENHFGSDVYEETLKCSNGRFRVIGKKLVRSGN